MKIGVVINFNSVENMPLQLERLKLNGFDNCQLVGWNMSLLTAENANTLKKMFSEYDVKISAFWCGWEGPSVWDFIDGPLTLGLVPEQYRETRIKNLCNGADFAKIIGVENVVTHMGFIPEDPNNPVFADLCAAVKQVAEHVKKNGQYLLFETGQETPITMLRCFEEVGCDNLGVNLDTANLIMYGKANPVDALDVFGKYVRNLHAKDGVYPTTGRKLGDETRLGDGKVDFEKLFIKLKELGYDSYVTIEREIDGDKQIEDIIYAKAYLEKIIGKIYG